MNSKFENKFDFKRFVNNKLIYKQKDTIYSILDINNLEGFTPRTRHYSFSIYIEHFKKCFIFNDSSACISKIPIPSFDNFCMIFF